MLNCVLHVERLFSNTCSIRLDDDISWTTYWAVDPIWRFCQECYWETTDSEESCSAGHWMLC